MNMLSGYLLTGSSATAHEGNKLFTNVYSISSKAGRYLRTEQETCVSKRESRNAEGLMHRGSCNIFFSFPIHFNVVFFTFFFLYDKSRCSSVLKRTANGNIN